MGASSMLKNPVANMVTVGALFLFGGVWLGGMSHFSAPYTATDADERGWNERCTNSLPLNMLLWNSCMDVEDQPTWLS
jgi:hypothetical protein